MKNDGWRESFVVFVLKCIEGESFFCKNLWIVNKNCIGNNSNSIIINKFCMYLNVRNW